MKWKTIILEILRIVMAIIAGLGGSAVATHL